MMSQDAPQSAAGLSLEELTSPDNSAHCVCNNLRMTSRAITRFYGETAGPGP